MKIAITLFFVLILAGCSTLRTAPVDWTPTQQIEKAVWADDGSEIAYLLQQYEERANPNDSSQVEKRNIKHQVIAQNVDGSNKRALTTVRDNLAANIYYMRQAGYLVIESWLGDTGARQIDRVATDSNKEILIIETPHKDRQPCPADAEKEGKIVAQVAHSVIPSPDGKQLAHVYSPECGKVTIEFLYANNLSAIDSQLFDIQEPCKVTWHPEQYLILMTQSGSQAWKIRPLQPAETITIQQCNTPLTTSSDISAEGRKVLIENGNITFQEVGKAAVFGCR